MKTLYTHHGLYEEGSCQVFLDHLYLEGLLSEVILVTLLATIQNNAICPTNSLSLPLQIFWTEETTQTCPQDTSQLKLKKTTLFAGQ